MHKYPVSAIGLVFQHFTVLCNSCGKPMRDMGEWPVRYPKLTNEEEQNYHPGYIQQAARFACGTCRVPNDRSEHGLPVIVSMIPDPGFLKHNVDESVPWPKTAG